MNILSKLLLGLGLFITVTGNLATFYGLYTGVNGMRNAEAAGIAAVAWGMSSAYFWISISLVGCLILIVGALLGVLKSSTANRT